MKLKFYFILVLFPNFLFADIDAYSNLWTGLSSNAFYLDSVGNTMISGIGFGLRQFSDNSNISYFGELNYTNYHSFTDRNHLNLASGINYFKPIGSKKNQRFNFSANIYGRIDSEIYNVYDFWQPSMQFNYIYNLSNVTYLQLGYSPKLKYHPYYSGINYSENNLNSMYKTYFDTKTTINLSLSYLNKSYFSTPVISNSNSIFQKSKMNSLNQIQKKEKWGKIIKVNNTKNVNTNLNSLMRIGKVHSQIQSNLKIGQNLNENLGLSVNLTFNSSLNSEKSDSLQGVSVYNGDIELFDDSYSYSGLTFSPTVTYLLPWDIISRYNFTYSNKKYNYMVESSEKDFNQRKDNYYMISATFERSFEINDSFIKAIGINFSSSYLVNNSNTFLFDYSNSDISVGMEINF